MSRIRLKGLCRLLCSISGCLFLLLPCTDTTARDKVVASLLLSGGLSYTGLSTYVTAGAGIKRHSIYLGPKYVTSRSFVSGRSLWGINAGYSFTVTAQGRWGTVLIADYQATFGKPPIATKTNTTHETALALGLQYQIIPAKLGVLLHMGAGAHIERYYNHYTLSKASVTGFFPLVKIGLQYTINR